MLHMSYGKLSKNAKVALKVKSQGQLSPKSNHFWGTITRVSTMSHKFLIISFSVTVWTHQCTNTRMV